MTPEGAQIVGKIRSIADRLWQKGRRVVVVGSTSVSSAEMREKIEELSLAECHFVPFEAEDAALVSTWNRQDTIADNLRHVRAMLSALAGRPVEIEALLWGVALDLDELLLRTVYDVDWIYRFSTQILGHQGLRDGVYDTQALLEASRSVRAREEIWQRSGSQPPYYSPLSTYIAGGSVSGGGGLES